MEEINVKQFSIDPFERFNSDWAVVTAGPIEKNNGMTISWGSMGTIWNKPIVTIYVRPDRFTWRFLKENGTFTVAFFPAEKKPDLLKMGRISGRDCDKAAECGLTPRDLGGCVSYDEAVETLVCRKIYMNQLNYDAVPDYAKQIYQNGIEPHYLIMGEITEVL